MNIFQQVIIAFSSTVYVGSSTLDVVENHILKTEIKVLKESKTLIQIDTIEVEKEVIKEIPVKVPFVVPYPDFNYKDSLTHVVWSFENGKAMPVFIRYYDKVYNSDTLIRLNDTTYMSYYWHFNKYVKDTNDKLYYHAKYRKPKILVR